MIISVSNEGVALQQPDDFTRFKVSAGPGVDVDLQLRRAQWGSGVEDAEALIAIDAIRHAVVDADAAWNSEFRAMLAYAETEGWLSDDLSHILAHVERVSG